MRLLFVCARWRPDVGGTERQAELLAAELARRGHRVTVLTHARPGSPSREEAGGVELLRLPPAAGGRGASALFGLRVARHAARAGRGYDAFQGFLASAPALFLLGAGRRVGRPVLLKLGASGPMGDAATSRRTLVGRAKLALLRRGCARFLCPNGEIRREIAALGFPPERSVLLPNGVPVDDLRPPAAAEREAARRALGWEERAVVLFVGRLEPQKDPLGLLEAWGAVAARRPGALLALAGDGSLRAAAEGLAARSAPAGAVAFPGPQDRTGVRRLLAAADLFVLPSQAEGISNALLEAMACGLPAVASDIPGNRDVVTDGADGLLVPPGRPAELAAAVGRLLDDPAERTAFGAAARRRVESGFSLAATADRYLAVLGELAGPR